MCIGFITVSPATGRCLKFEDYGGGSLVSSASGELPATAKPIRDSRALYKITSRVAKGSVFANETTLGHFMQSVHSNGAAAVEAFVLKQARKNTRFFAKVCSRVFLTCFSHLPGRRCRRSTRHQRLQRRRGRRLRGDDGSAAALALTTAVAAAM